MNPGSLESIDRQGKIDHIKQSISVLVAEVRRRGLDLAGTAL